MSNLNDEVIWDIDPKTKSLEINEREANYIDALIRFAGRKFNKHYKTLLDLPCGAGRIDKYLKKYGYDTYGVDINTNLIKKAKINCNLPNNYFVGDMRTFNLNTKFDVILSWFTSFGYFNEKENELTLKNFSSHLKKGGILVLDIRLDCSDNLKEFNEIDEFDNVVRLIKSKGEKRNGLSYGLHDAKFYNKKGKDLIFIKNLKVPIRLYDNYEITELLNNVGIKVRYSFERMSFKLPTPASRSIVLVCLKR